MGARVGRPRLLPRRGAVRSGAVLHRDPAAERHRTPARGSRPRPHDRGHADPARADAGVRGALGPRHGSRRHRHAGRGGARAAQGGHRSSRHRPGGVRRTRVGVEGTVRRRDRRPDQADGSVPGLVARAVHHGRGALAGRTGGVRPLVRGRPDLSGRTAGQLVPDRPNRAIRLRGRARGHRGRARHVPVRAVGRVGLDRVRHDPRRDDAGRHRDRGASERRAVRPPDRHDRASSVRRPGHPDRRGRRDRPGVRDGRREGHAGARPRRLRHRAACRPAAHEHLPRGRDDQRERGRGVLRARALRRADRGARGAGEARPGRRGDPAVRALGRTLLSLSQRDRAVDRRPAVVRRRGSPARAGEGCGPRRPDRVLARTVAAGLRVVARQPARLEHLPAAVVGTSHPGVVLPGRPRHRLAGRPRRVRHVRVPRTPITTARRRRSSSVPAASCGCTPTTRT